MEWISVEDQLPMYGETILIVVDGVVQKITYFRDGSDNSADWCEPCFFGDEDSDTWIWWSDVSHWMPLPAPPKERSHD